MCWDGLWFAFRFSYGGWCWLSDFSRRLVRDIRDELLASGLGPEGLAGDTGQLVSDALRRFETRELRSGHGPVSSSVAAQVVQDLAGLGPLQSYLDDDDVEEIWINEPGHVFVARGGCSELTNVVLRQEEVEVLVERMLRSTGRRIDLSSPFVDARLPGGHRLHVVIPPITRFWAVNIRKFVAPVHRVGDMVSLGSLTAQAARFLEGAAAAGLNVLVSGATQAGKTTLLRALAHSIPQRTRIITIEEVAELNLSNRDVVAMETRDKNLEGRGEVTMRALVRESLRMRPERLIVGEVRQAEALDLLIALNSGLPAMATIHANSASDAVAKLCILPLLAGPNVSPEFVVPTVAGAIDLVVHVESFGEGKRRVREICAVPGSRRGSAVDVEPLFALRHGQLVRTELPAPRPDLWPGDTGGADLVSQRRPVWK